MAFREIVERFCGKGLSYEKNLKVLKTFCKTTNNGSESVDEAVVDRRMEFGYLRLREHWQTLKSLNPSSLSKQAARRRLHLLFVDGKTLWLFSDLIAQDKEVGVGDHKAFEKILSSLLSRTRRYQRRRSTPHKSGFEVISDFIDLALDSQVTDYDQAIMLSCKDRDEADDDSIGNLAKLIDPTEQIDPLGATVLLDSSSKDDCLILGIFKTSLNPRVQAVRILRGVETLRHSTEAANAGYESISAASWLVSPERTRLLKLSGLKELAAQTCYYGVSNLLDNPDPFKILKDSPFSFSELLFSSVYSIGQSPNNLARFIADGTLPNVGAMRIPTADFFQRK